MLTNKWLNDHPEHVPIFGPSPLHQHALEALPLNELTLFPLRDLLPFTLPPTILATKIPWKRDIADMTASVNRVLAPYFNTAVGCWFRPLSWDALEQTICFSRPARTPDVSDGFGHGMYASNNLVYALSLTGPGAVLMVFHGFSESDAAILDLPTLEWFRVVDKFMNIKSDSPELAGMTLEFMSSDFIRGPLPRRMSLKGPLEVQFEQSHIIQICAKSRKAFAMLNSSLKAIILLE
ncbi:hypothetical protein PENSTE_c025G05361 [Penicillium steckii]|uniref:Uncharacterized protein n=1 Tax=Penicillium steckii TaxID=303698 RepID=A0A1V6SQ43_9EURO|nr:hypothetical protein PENSTE_c025G05361 [Penicillium steckii]